MHENKRGSGVLCIIPARGGSQRIPRKNLRDFMGRPIIHYAIKAAIASNCFEEVMVSTEDREIEGASVAAGAVVPFLRSAEASSHHATMGEVWAEVIQEYKNRGRVFRMVCSILPTAVFVTPQIILEVLQLLDNQPEWDGVMPVITYSPPIQRALHIKNNTLYPVWSEYSMIRSQDLEPRYFDAGQLYAFRPEYMMSAKSMRKGNIGAFPLAASKAQDIDTEEDWVVAEQKFSLFGGTHG